MTTQYTTLDVTLSAALTQELNQADIYAYAVYVNVNLPKDPTNGYPLTWYTLADDGKLYQNGQQFQWAATPVEDSMASVEIPLNNLANPAYSSGLAYIIVASNDKHQKNFTKDFQAAIAGQSNISWTTASTWDYAYDTVEITVDGNPGDAADLTDINGYALPAELSTTYSDGTTSTRGYSTATSIPSALGAITDIYNFSQGPLTNLERMAVAPPQALDREAQSTKFQTSDWNSYVQALETSLASNPIFLSGVFDGTAASLTTNNVARPAAYYDYEVTWDPMGADPATGAVTGCFWLTPLGLSQATGYIKFIPGDDTGLQDNIYSTVGTYLAYPLNPYTY
jgi:hypothetical protein